MISSEPESSHLAHSVMHFALGILVDRGWHVYWCLFLLVHVCRGQSLLVHTCWGLYVPVRVCWSLYCSVFAGVASYLSACLLGSICTSLCLNLFPYVPVSLLVHVCLGLSVLVHVCLGLSVLVHVCLGLSVLVHVCRSLCLCMSAVVFLQFVLVSAAAFSIVVHILWGLSWSWCVTGPNSKNICDWRGVHMSYLSTHTVFLFFWGGGGGI